MIFIYSFGFLVSTLSVCKCFERVAISFSFCLEV
ncbi:hypothetical protein LINPERHAP2_LOCUS12533, partial [Linum perenne]